MSSSEPRDLGRSLMPEAASFPWSRSARTGSGAWSGGHVPPPLTHKCLQKKVIGSPL